MSILNITPREYQQRIFETTSNSNTLVVLPTGLGKTLIALLLSIDRLKKFPMSKIVFLAPTKPLVEQHFEYYQSNLPELFAELSLFTGSVSAGKRKKLWQTAEVIFSTPQCVANDLKNRLYDLKETSLLIIDEAHRCLKNYDYTSVVNFYKSQSTNPRILGLTASPGQDSAKVREICRHLDIQEIELRTRDSEDVKPYLKEREFSKIEVSFPQEFIEVRVLLKRIWDSKVERLRSSGFLNGPANKIALLELQKRLAIQATQKNFAAMGGMSLTAQAIKISHAIELLETQTLSGLDSYMKNLMQQANEQKSKAVQQLVKSPEFNAALLSISHLLARKIEHPKIEEIASIVEEEIKNNAKAKIILFTQFRETAARISERLNKIKDTRSAIFIGQTKKLGLGLSQKEQKAIVDKFKAGEVNVLIATSIGEEGLDIPEVNAVIFYEPIPSAIRKIQRAGRTARLSPGKLFILVTKDTRDEINHYASSAREKKMYTTVEMIKRELKEKKKFPSLNNFPDTKPHKL
ncbi:MAG: DEAD/DEAH box helicase [Nanoarchaeota archaeon]|nr:DEAD/DEAH box helicase [Nanoarchaeota archaeon]